MVSRSNYTYLLFSVLSVCSVVILSGCYQRTYIPARNYDFSTTYTTEKTKAMPHYVVHNISDTVSRLYYLVRSSDLLYERSNVDNKLTAHILVQYILHPVDRPKEITDSGRVFMNDVNETGAVKYIAGYADFDVPGTGDFYLEVTLRDLNKLTITFDLIHIQHGGANARNNFILTAPGTENPLYRDYILKDEWFSIRHNSPLTSKLYVAYYKNTSTAARPPYAMPVVEPEILPDSTWSIDICQTCSLQLPEEGYYVFTTTAESKYGFTVCRFGEGYPKITTPIALLEPLRYITTKKEYTTLETSTKLKASVDSFWISTAGSPDRARELISAYYGRVEIANIHFSSNKEGWKTDRGMVYIIYGEPQNVYRTAINETWVYGQDQSGNMLTFVFDRNTKSAVPNDFILARNQTYNISWITAVDYWKQGQVYRAR